MTAILTRIDANQVPVVFIADTFNKEAGTIQAWIKGAPQVVSLDYYHTTQPLSEADEKILAQRYSRSTGDNNVTIRQRLPRTERVIPNRLAKEPRQKPPVEAAPLPVVAETPVAVPNGPAAPTPEQMMAVLEQQRVEFMQQMAARDEQMAKLIAALTPTVGRTRSPRKAAARKAAAKPMTAKATTRRRAKPLESKI
jgi:hypothetical protein